jgi:WD40 repeat protein
MSDAMSDQSAVGQLVSDPRTNPFPGLRPFREDEEHLFFGRENQVDAMVDKLADTRFLAVVGTSGSGKSSLVNCGLRPGLRKGFMARAGIAWRMVQFRPGNNPIRAMASALGQEGALFHENASIGMTLVDVVEANLRMSKLGLVDVYDMARLDHDINLLVVVDQFEELFRYRQVASAEIDAARIGEDAVAFVNLLLEIKEHPNVPIFIVLTMRSDFLGDCTQFPGLAEAINAGQYLVPRLTRDERRAAIEGPVLVARAEIAAVLLTRLVNDVGDNPDQLSILQHALNRTWAHWQEERHSDQPLDMADYEAIGTMAHALDQHAERAYAELDTPRLQQISERVFKALTDKATDPRGVRRPTTLAKLCELTNASEAEITQAIAGFRGADRSFLMPPAGEPLLAGTVIDISHESLMRVWQRLIGWADEEAQSARIYRRLAEAAELHKEGNASLWRDPELQLALDWCDTWHPNEAWASRYHTGFTTAMQFLDESRAARDAEQAERRRQRELALQAEREKAAAQAKQKKIWIGLSTCCFLALLYAMYAGYNSWRAEQDAKKAAQQAEVAEQQAKDKQQEAERYLHESEITQSQSLIASIKQVYPDDPTMRLLLSLEALPDETENNDRPFVYEAGTALAAGLADLRELANFQYGGGTVAITRDGSHIVTTNGSEWLVWDAGTGAKLPQPSHAVRPGEVISIMPDGTRAIARARDGTSRLFDALTGSELHSLNGKAGRVLAATPDGSRIVTLGQSGQVQLWDTNSGDELKPLNGQFYATGSVAITPDRTRIVAVTKDGVQVSDVSSGDKLFDLGDQTDHIQLVAISQDGTRIVTTSAKGTIKLWSASDGKGLAELKDGGTTVGSVAMPVGTHAVTVSGDGIVRVWDNDAGGLLLKFNMYQSVSKSSAAPDNARIVTVDGSNRVHVWDVSTPLLYQLEEQSGAVRGPIRTYDGTRIIAGSGNDVRIWDARTGGSLLRIPTPNLTTEKVSIMPDATRIVGGVYDVTPLQERLREQDLYHGKVDGVLNSSTASAVRNYQQHHMLSTAGVLNKDTLASMNLGVGLYSARLWDASTGIELLRLPREGQESAIRAVAVAPDGSSIVTGSDDGITRVWGASDGRELFRLPGEDTGEFNSAGIVIVGMMPDGDRIVTGSRDGTIRVWDVKTHKMVLQLPKGQRAALRTLAVTPDGSRIVIGLADGNVEVWTANRGEIVLSFKAHDRSIRDVAITSDSSRIITSSDDGSARVWAASTGAELYRLKGSADTAASPTAGLPVSGAVTQDGSLVVTGGPRRDEVTRVWDVAQFRRPPHEQFSTKQARQSLIEQAKHVVPRCLSINEREEIWLDPTPPGWCIDLGKYPYDSEQWRAWRAGKEIKPSDSKIAGSIGDYADHALKAGYFFTALKAADLGLKFDPSKNYIQVNRAHALMFLGDTQRARDEYRSHRGEAIRDIKIHDPDGTDRYKLWEESVIEDFQKLRELGREDPLMAEIEASFKSPPAAK